jgi:hypothetical protein
MTNLREGRSNLRLSTKLRRLSASFPEDRAKKPE